MAELNNKGDLLASSLAAFKSKFHYDATVAASAPGRVNLIGEHTDYNEGFVLPMAIPLYTIVVGRLKESGSCRLLTMCSVADHPREVEFQVPSDQTPLLPGQPKWANYVKGVVANYKGLVKPFDAVISSSVPIGGGLSSSASLEVAFYTFLDALNGHQGEITLTEKALSCQKAEHDFALMPCGIMDQFIAFMGKEGCALLIDCKSLESELVPIKATNLSILITNSNVRHELTGTEYSSRRQLCEEAARRLKKPSLRFVTIEDLKGLNVSEKSEIYRRVKHVISEIERTEKAAKVLEDSDFPAFGKLMIQSHVSLKEDYEVSCPELDQLVDLALKVPGVYGSRMTGGGFGGCTVTLLETSAVNEAMDYIKTHYQGEPVFYVCRPAEGAHPITIPS